MSPYLQGLKDLADPRARRKVLWTPAAAAMAAVLMAMQGGCPLNLRWEDAWACLGMDCKGRGKVGTTYNGLIKALQRQAHVVLPMLKADLRRQAPTCAARR